MSHLITVVTPTLGDSCGHLNRMIVDLKEMTNLSFRQIVSDDGTADFHLQDLQRLVCQAHDVQWTENPGPLYGVSYNLNHAFNLVETPWAFVVEDGLRASKGWLETAVDTVKRIGQKQWCGHEVGMMGCASFEDWQLALAGILPTRRSFLDFWQRSDAETYSAFWGGRDWPNWNDGLWCWKRLLPRFEAVCALPESDLWPPGVLNFRHVIRTGTPPPGLKDICRCPAHSWPGKRTAGCAWFPGAFMLVNMDAWRAVGRWADGCTFFEGHLGIRMALGGYISLALEFPPWLHYAGMGFVNAGTQGKRPRHHEPADGPNSILLKDFGCDGEGHCDLYALVDKVFPLGLQDEINRQLAEVPLYADPTWEVWK